MAIRRAISDKLHRLRHFRGHGVHSPYIYEIKRKVFMRRKLFERREIGVVAALEVLGLRRRVVRELHNIYIYCGYASFAVDPSDLSEYSFVVLSRYRTDDWAEVAHKSGTTVVVLKCREWGRAELDCVAAKHTSTTVDRRDYLLMFNNHLPKQHFIL